jgi:hypothetical protein
MLPTIVICCVIWSSELEADVRVWHFASDELQFRATEEMPEMLWLTFLLVKELDNWLRRPSELVLSLTW